MKDKADWFGSWNDIGDAALSALLFYVLIVMLVRLIGNRSTAQLNNFDWIINITLGSLAASGILLNSVPAGRAGTAIVVLMLLQYALTRLATRHDWFAQLIKTQPTLLMDRGKYLEDAMRCARVSKEEVRAALREAGVADAADAGWVVLETDGSLTVIPRENARIDRCSVMGDVSGFDTRPGDDGGASGTAAR